MKKNHLLITLNIIVFLFCTSIGKLYAQTVSEEKAEPLLACWQNEITHLQTTFKASNDDYNAFLRYYSSSLTSDQVKFYRLVWKGKIDSSNINTVIKKIDTKYSDLYNKFISLKVSSPTTVSEFYKAPKAPDGICNPADINIGFENGDLSGWTAAYADCSAEGTGTATSFLTTTPTSFGPLGAGITRSADDPSTTSYQVSIMAGGNDKAVPSIPRVSPTGGSYSVMVGDGANPGYGVAILSQSFTVTASNDAFTYQYAFFLQYASSHSYYQQTYFRVLFLDQLGDTIKCASWLHTGNDTVGFSTITYNGAPLVYKNWTSVLVPLDKYIGQCVTVKFITSDCGQGGHFGYAYVDASTAPLKILQSSPAICSSPITLTAPTGASYLWSGPCISGPPNTQTITIGCAGKYSVIIKNPTGSCNSADTLTTNIVSGSGTAPIPKVTADSVCPGSPTQFTNTTSGTGNKYQWNFGDPLSGINDTTSAVNPTHTYPKNGTYTVTFSALQGECGRDTTFTVFVRSNPKITITSSPANDTVCTGSSITLSGNGGVSYSWSGGVTNATPFVPASSGKYVVIGTDTHGCSNKDSVNVGIDKPAVTIVSSPANDSVCKGSSITLSGSGGKTYAWSGGITNATPFIPSSSGKYVVTGTDSKGCSNKDSVMVTIDVPALTITSSPANDTVCPGSKMTLTASGAWYYSWTGGIYNGNPFSPSSSGKYVVTGTDDNGCTSKDSVNVIAGTGALPTVTCIAADTICKGSSVTLTASGASYYNWSGGVKNGVPFTPAASGKYIVTGTGTNGCSNTDTVNVVLVGPNPAIKGQLYILPGTNDTLIASGALSYVWNPSADTKDTLIVSPASTTTYTLTGMDKYGCTDTATFVVTILNVTGVNNVSQVNSTNIYPNPTDATLNLQFNTSNNKIQAVIKIADITGKEWIAKNVIIENNKTISVDVSSLASGMYFIQVQSNSYTRTMRFIKK